MKGQTTVPIPSSSCSAGSGMACRSTTLPARSCSAARNSARSVAARPAVARTRLAASPRAQSLARRCTRRGIPPLASASRSTGGSMSSRAPAYSRATAATPPSSSGVSVRIAAVSSRAASPASSAVTSTSSGNAANPPQSSASAGHSQSPARSASSITRSEGRRVARAFAQHLAPRVGGAQVGDVQHLAALAVRLGSQLRREPRLAHPARPRDQH